MSSSGKDRRRISELRNLGPKCEYDLNSVGIDSLDDLRELGVEQAFVRVVIGRMRRGQDVSSLNLNYLYALHGALYDVDWRRLAAEDKQRYRLFLADMRASGSLKRRGPKP
ncbi:MAG: TfoX/Sxy family protein [bacterium]|nr:TfoX/Sxy family protein [bacterium]